MTRQCIVLLLWFSSAAAAAALPRIAFDDFVYEGAFRLPASTFGASSLNYSQGPIEYNAASSSLFIVGHSHHQAIAEFPVPPLVVSTSLADLNMAGDPLQPFARVLSRVSGGNPQNIDRIGGMKLIGQELIHQWLRVL